MPEPSTLDLEAFVTDGFVRLAHAFPREIADAARAILWRDTGCDPDRPRHVDAARHPAGDVRAAAVRRRRQHATRCTPPSTSSSGRDAGCRRDSLGTFPVRFPSPDDPGDAGWHVDASFGYDHPDFMAWRVNVRSRGRALLMLFLFSDVGEARRADAHPRRLASRDGPPARTGRRRRPVAARPGRQRLRGDGPLPRSAGDGRGGHGLPVPPVPRPRRPAASRHAAAVHGPAAAAAGAPQRPGHRARRGSLSSARSRRARSSKRSRDPRPRPYCSW